MIVKTETYKSFNRRWFFDDGFKSRFDTVWWVVCINLGQSHPHRWKIFLSYKRWWKITWNLPMNENEKRQSSNIERGSWRRELAGKRSRAPCPFWWVGLLSGLSDLILNKGRKEWLFEHPLKQMSADDSSNSSTFFENEANKCALH